MRGVQVSDENGQVHFESIYPGWHPDRVPHIPFKVILEDRTAVTSQLYFPTEISSAVYELPPYNVRGESISEFADSVLGGRSPDSLRMTLSGDSERFVASHSIGIATAS